MPDPQLVAYLRKNLKRFGADALRRHLSEEGVSEAEFEEALPVASRPDERKPPLMMYGALAGAAVAACAAFLALDKTPKAKDSGAPHAATAPPAAAAPEPGRPGQQFLGHYGFLLQIPPGYKTLTDFRDVGNTTETVYLFPDSVDPTNVKDEGLYAQLGIMRLEASPRRFPEGNVGFESLRSGVLGTLTRRGDTFTSKEFKVGSLSAFAVNVSQPLPLAQTFVVGSRFLYVFTGGAEDSLYNETLQSLHEGNARPPDAEARQ